MRTRTRSVPALVQVVLLGATGSALAVAAGAVAAAGGLATAGPEVRAVFGFLVGASRTTPAQRWLGGGRLDNRLVLRLAIGYVLFAALAEVVGMPFLFPLGAALTVSAALQWSGARAWRHSILGLLVASMGSAATGGMLDSAHILSSPFTKDQMGSIYLGSALLGIMTIINAAALATAREASEVKLEDERSRRHDELLHAATHDGLTGLLNRAGLAEILPDILASATPDRGVGLLYLDLDGFKAVNDTLGHGAGDELLKLTARRLQQVLRDSDRVARLGGDEFVVVVRGVDRPESLVMLAGRLEAALSAPFDLDGVTGQVGASIGAAMAPEPAVSAEELMARADAAMYEVKSRHHQQTHDQQTHDQQTHDQQTHDQQAHDGPAAVGRAPVRR